MASNVSTNRFHVLTLIYMMLGWAWHSNPRPEPSSSGCSIPMEEILKGARNRRQAQLWCKCHYCRRCKVGLSVTVFGVIRHIQAVSLFLSAPLRFDMRQPPFLSQELYCRKRVTFFTANISNAEYLHVHKRMWILCISDWMYLVYSRAILSMPYRSVFLIISRHQFKSFSRIHGEFTGFL